LLQDREHEVFGALFLDSQHRVLAFEELFRGTLDSASIYPREVVKRALILNSGAILAVHNHPSGDPEPSQSDRVFTQALKEALALVDVRLLDHLVVGAEGVVSLAERGQL
ncbi:MAG: JAB domain-containing protein, partial [Aeromonas sobria]